MRYPGRPPLRQETGSILRPSSSAVGRIHFLADVELMVVDSSDPARQKEGLFLSAVGSLLLGSDQEGCTEEQFPSVAYSRS